MGIITRMLKQTAVYWAPASVDAYGRPMHAAPVEISCRWEDVVQQFLDEAGATQVSRAVVYVGQDVEVKGVLLLGSLTSSVNQADPKANDGAWEIRRFEKLPKLNAREFLRTAIL